jgi:hypothetical protein
LHFKQFELFPFVVICLAGDATGLDVAVTGAGLCGARCVLFGVEEIADRAESS